MNQNPGKVLAFDQTWQQSIEQDHHSIKEVLERLDATADPNRLLALLDELRTSLVEHFAREEAPEGMHEIVSSMSPSSAASLQNVLAEHGDLLAHLDRLRQRTREIIEGPVAGLRADAAALSQSLRSHEARESRLFTDAVFTDLGRSS
jgi:Hemerythrin HHE cation binding domain